MLPSAIHQVLAETWPILFDFDGPVCDVFAGLPAPGVAADLRLTLEGRGADTKSVRTEQDPLMLLRWTAEHHPDLVTVVDDELRRAEMQAVASAKPTPLVWDVIRECSLAGRPCAIVSNNSEPAIRAYLSAHHLLDWFGPLVGRTYATPSQMKPNPAPILDAVSALKVDPRTCILIGDSVSDIHAAHSAGVRSIGYANKPGKAKRLTDAGADAIVGGPNGMGGVAAGLRSMSPDRHDPA